MQEKAGSLFKTKMFALNDPGPLNITFGSAITFLISEFTTQILLISIRWSNVIGISDPNVIFKGPGTISATKQLNWTNLSHFLL